MFEPVLAAIDALFTEADAYPDGMRFWMRLMAGSLFSSIIFVFWKNGARWVFATALLTMLGLMLGKTLYPDLARETIGTVVHLTLWPFLLFALWRPTARRARVQQSTSLFERAYPIWLIWVSFLVSLSLFLDGRTALRYLMS